MKKILLFVVPILLIPQICSASFVMMFDYSLYVFCFIVFLGIWMIGAIYINKKLQGHSSKALLSILIANIIGITLSYFITAGFIQRYIPNDEVALGMSFPYIIAIFLISFIFIEGLTLWLFYRNEKFGRMISLSFFISVRYILFSLIFILAIFAFNINLLFLTVSITLSSLVIMPYTFLKVFKFISIGRKFPKSKKNIINAILLLASFVLAFIISFSFIFPGKGFFGKSLDKAVREQISVLKERGASLYYSGEYSDFCNSSDNIYGDILIEHTKDRIDLNYSTLYCGSSNDYWIACAQLVNDKKHYICIDYKGNEKEIEGTCDDNLVKNNKICF